MTAVSIRGIYATALTRLLSDGDDFEIVQASDPIEERFGTSFSDAPASATITDTDDRLGVGVTSTDEQTGETVTNAVSGVGIDALSWADPIPTEAVFDGRVSDTTANGAIVEFGDREGYLPARNTDEHLAAGDSLCVQVARAVPPWADDRPVLRTEITVSNAFARLIRGESVSTTSNAIDLTDLVSTEPRSGWAVRWSDRATDVSFDVLTDALSVLNERADSIERALSDPPGSGRRVVPLPLWWVWFGRRARFGLDEHRREVATTIDGHHRIKAGTDAASAAVDFTESVCEPTGAFPFDVTVRQFGPTVGDRIALAHGKPDGRCFVLGRGEITERAGKTITLERQMSPGGSYDALGVERQPGDVAITKLKEGRWWYPTVYRGTDGHRRGTYVNVCTPVEIFPEMARYVDLHVDVVKHSDGTVERVDDEELDGALEQGLVSKQLAQRARTVATSIERALSE